MSTVSPSVCGAGARIDQPGDGYALGAFSAMAGLVRPVVVFAFGAKGFENPVGGVVVVGWFWWLGFSANGNERLDDRAGVLLATDFAAEDPGRVGGYWSAVHWYTATVVPTPLHKMFAYSLSNGIFGKSIGSTVDTKTWAQYIHHVGFPSVNLTLISQVLFSES